MSHDPALRTTLHLDGTWDLAFPESGQEDVASWVHGQWPESQSEPVEVPALWNITHPDREGVAYYRCRFTVPADWADRTITLRFEGVSYRADVWVNGARVGGHEGAYTPFAFDVTRAIRVGASDNQLVVRVASLSRTQNVDGMVLIHSPASKQTWHYTHGGIWGAVSLEARSLLSCVAVVVEPDPRQEMAVIELTIQNDKLTSQPLDLTQVIARPDGSLAADQTSALTVPPGTVNLTYRIPLPRPVLWDCENPNLYRLEVGITGQGSARDQQSVRFGMRDFTVRDGQFLLNGEPIYLRGVLLQPNYPISIVVPPSQEMMVREITLAKEAGFNLIRCHIRPAPPGYLELTDEMGMLIYAESCLAWIKDNPRLLDHGRRELRAMIERDRNHPSVVFWGIHNENRAASALTSDALIRHVRSLDPTRVIVDNSGGTMAIDQDFGWVDRTTVVPSRSSERERIQDLHIYVGAPIPGPVYEWMRTLGITDLDIDMTAHDYGSAAVLQEWNRELRTYSGKVFVSELGVGGLADLDAVVSGFAAHEALRDAREMTAFQESLHQGFAERKLDLVFGNVSELVQRTQEAQAVGLTRQIEALLTNPRVSGFIVTQLNDVSWEFHAGVLDHWRNPKRVYYALKRLHQPQCLVLKAARPVAACGEEVEVALTLVNSLPLVGAGRVEVMVIPPGGTAEVAYRKPAPCGAGIKELSPIRLTVGSRVGQWRVEATLVDAGGVLAESAESVLVLEQPDLREMAVGVSCVGGVPAALEQLVAKSVGEPTVRVAARPADLSERQWLKLLDDVASGEIAIIGPLHTRDQVALELLREHGIPVQLDLGIGSWMGCFHWVSDPTLLEGVQDIGLAGEPFVDVLPWYVMSELGGTVRAGAFRNTQTRRAPPMMLWYSDIEAVHLGKGMLLLCQYRIFDRAHENPLAGRMLHNLLHVAEGYRARQSEQDGAL
jgi:beta-galactosidase